MDRLEQRRGELSGEQSTWDDADPSESAQRRVGLRTTDAFELPNQSFQELESKPTQLAAGFDFDDVGPTEVSQELAEDPLSDVPMYEPFRSGDRLGRYRIERMLGRGATGVVYEASHAVVGRRVALKCLFPHMAAVPTQVQRLFREARISATVEHPNVVKVFDGGRDKETYFLAMELLEGRTLAELLEEGRISLKVVVDIFLQVMSGVAAVHEAGVVHRDLKPDNIFMQMRPDDPLDPGIPKVLDFGVSKLYEQSNRPASKLTAMGMVMGTPYYMAPEQVADTSGVDQRADVYSLGVILYEVVTGKLPYEGESVIEIFTQAQDGGAPNVRLLRPEVPPAFAALIHKAMSADKEVRYQSVSEMREALRTIPFDGTEGSEEWSDKSQPWLLDKDSGVVRRIEPVSTPSVPLEQVSGQRALPTPLSSPRPPISPPADPAPLEDEGLPAWMLVLAAALAGGVLALIGAAVLYFVLKTG